MASLLHTIAGLKDEKNSLLASIRYRHNARGQVMIEGKDDARKRGVKSPDRAEALMLAFTPVFESTIIVDTWEENRREDQSLLTITER